MESKTGFYGNPPEEVDPRAPRFGQGVTATLLGLAIVLQEPAPVYLVALVLGTAAVSGWRIDLYGLFWRNVVSEFVGEPGHMESASPHRFAKLVGAVFTLLASAALYLGVPLVGYLLAGVVAGLAGLAATTGICVGCRMYRQVGFFRRLGVV